MKSVFEILSRAPLEYQQVWVGAPLEWKNAVPVPLANHWFYTMFSIKLALKSWVVPPWNTKKSESVPPWNEKAVFQLLSQIIGFILCFQWNRPWNPESCLPGMTKSLSRCFPGMKKRCSNAFCKSLVLYYVFNETGLEMLSRWVPGIAQGIPGSGLL